MKSQLLLLLVVLIASAFAGINQIKRHAGRTTSPETVDFQLIYLGSCDQFYAISRVAISILNTACLPINDTQPFLENDDLSADVLCTNIGPGRSQIDFVEIYQFNDTTPYTGGFAISFVPNAPFRAISGGVSYVRRPTCTTQKDFCSATNYVHTCQDNVAEMRKGFVISNDLVFIIPASYSAVGCGSAINSCCSYLNAGFCPFTAPSDLLNLPHNNYYGNNQQQQQQSPPHRPAQQNHAPVSHDDEDYEDAPAQPAQQYQPAPPQQYQPAQQSQPAPAQQYPAGQIPAAYDLNHQVTMDDEEYDDKRKK